MNVSEDWSMGLLAKMWAAEHQLEAIYWPEITSTNAQAKEMSVTSPELLLVSDFQSEGRGRNDNLWNSPEKGSALLSSWVFLSKKPVLPQLTPRIGLALWRAASAIYPQLAWSLKAPNDLYLGDKKIAGILVESVSQGNLTKLIIGLGMNVFAKPNDVASSTCLAEHLSHFNHHQLLHSFSEFLTYLHVGLQESVEEAHELLPLFQREALASALNLRPNLTAKIKAVSAVGSLETEAGLTSWLEL